MSQKKQLAKNTIIIALGKISTQIISFLLLPIYTSMISTELYGTYDYLITISIFLIPIVTLLLEEAMFRLLIDTNSDKEKNRIIKNTIYIYIICIILLIIFYSIVGMIVPFKYKYLFLFYLISVMSLNLSNAILRGNGEIKKYSVINLSIGFVTILLNILCIVYFRMNVDGLFLSAIIPNIFVSSILIVKTLLRLPKNENTIDYCLVKKMLKYSIPLIPSSISFSIISLSDRIIITNILGVSLNGIYSISNKFPVIISVFFGYFYIAWKESASRISKDKNKDKEYLDIFNTIRNILLSVTIILLSFVSIVFDYLIDPNYFDAYYQIPILFIGVYYCCISMLLGGIFIAYKDTKLIGKTTSYAAIINLAINILFIKHIGLYAASISTLVAYYLLYLYRKIKMKKYLTIKFYSIDFYSLILIIINMALYYFDFNLIIKLLILLISIIYSIYVNIDYLKSAKSKIINMIKK